MASDSQVQGSGISEVDADPVAKPSGASKPPKRKTTPQAVAKKEVGAEAASAGKPPVKKTPGAAQPAAVAKPAKKAQTAEVAAAKPAAKPMAKDADKPADKQAAAAATENQTTAEADAGGDDDQPHNGPMLGRTGRFILLSAVPAWLVSMIIHALLLIVLAFWTLPDKTDLARILAIAEPVEEMEEIVDDLPDPKIEPVDIQELSDAPLQIADMEAIPSDMAMPEFEDLEAAPQQIKLDDFGKETAPKNELMTAVGALMGSGLSGRGAEARAQMVQSEGGSKGSEAAVAMALEWLAAHQQRDGGWDFNHQTGPCQGRCGNAGRIAASRNGATAIALLPFLGAGQTHKEGEYKEVVERGLYFLMRNMKVRNNMGDLSDNGGRMYSHGLCSIALCEAYAMTNDPALVNPAQLSLNYIVYAQDPVGGGWRYQPRTPGDTSVVGWQLMALKSGHMAYLRVPRTTILGSTKFLDTVQMDSGAKYGYTAPGEGQATTAVGLLCRMYLGWKKDDSAMQRGVQYLGNIGPNNNMYFNYYATQVMRHYGGDPWEKWNATMRDQLVNSQDKTGHQKGSWYINGPHADRGGRLYITAMATMILEVYYRHMPIYGQQAAEEDFPL